MDKPTQGMPRDLAWPSLPLELWQETCTTLHMWTQVVGKIRLALAPMLNHWWQVTLYVTPRGLTTSSMPYGNASLEVIFDFLDHELRIHTSEGHTRTLALTSRTVADFYRELMAELTSLGMPVRIWTRPVEIADPIPFDQDEVHRHYVPDHAQRFWRILNQSDRVLRQFRCGFMGKSSPVQFFWGSFDLAVSRFSGRAAPPHPGGIPNMADWVTRLAYSHEVSSCGFWPGGGPIPEPSFYAYAYPEPPGFEDYSVQPAALAHYDEAVREFILPYEAVRTADDPDAMILAFAQSTYEAAADLGHWDRATLEYRTTVSTV